MDTLAGTLIVCQALGALVGTICAVWGQLAHVKALRDGVIDRAERAHLDAIAHGLWVGMTLILGASLGLVVLAYSSGAPVQPAMTASYWGFMLLALLITVLTWALSRRLISFRTGSPAIFMAWWTLLFLAFGRFPDLTIGAMAAAYVVGTVIVYLVIQYMHAFVAHDASEKGAGAA